MKLLVTKDGEKHGLVNTIPNNCAVKENSKIDPEIKAKMEKAKKDDQRIVKARYLNHRGNHERLEKPYLKWPGEPIHFFKLIPGETYDLPYGLVKEINDPNRRLPVRSEILDANGIPTKKDGESLQIHELVPVGF